MGAKRLYLLFLLGILLPFFFPQARDTIVGWSRTPQFTIVYDGVKTTVTDYSERYAPATLALIKQAQVIVNGKIIQQVPTASGPLGPVPAAGDWRLKTGSTTLTSEQAEAILAEYDSPAKGYGYAFVTGFKKTGIDGGYVMAQFIKESTAGKNGVARYTKSSGNIIYTGSGENYGGFQVYPDWAAGIEAHFDLLNDYAEGRAPSGKRHETIDSAIEEWAPPKENDTPGYIREVHEMVSAWRQVNNPRPVEQQPAGPALAQSAAPGGFVEPWPGFLDSESYGLHSGARDYSHPEGTEVRAFTNGKFLQTGRYDDELRFGEYFMFVDDDGNEWYFGHLKGSNPMGLQPGERVVAGMVIGQLGPFYPKSFESGPHTHMQLRVNGALTDPRPVFEAIRDKTQAATAQPIQEALAAFSQPGANKVVYAPELLDSQGCVWTNSLASLQNNAGLRHITLKPGQSWSHNEAWATGKGQVFCGTIQAGGQCDMAGRYLNVAHQLGLKDGSDLLWTNHNHDLQYLDYADEVVIETGAYGTRNGADLVIVNNTDKTLRIEAQAVGDRIKTWGWFE